METIVLVLLMGGMNLLAFLIGARTSQKAQREEEIKLPTVNPIKAYKEHTRTKEAEKEQERIETMLENINNYDGTGLNQKDII
jgi:hypothetical protein